MPTYTAPGVYVEEKLSGASPIAGAGTSTAGFLGIFAAELTSVTIPRPVKGYNPSGKTPPSKISLEDEDDAVRQLVGRLLRNPKDEVAIEVDQLQAGTFLNGKTIDVLKTIANSGKLTQDINVAGNVEPDNLKVGDILLQPIKSSTNAQIQLNLNEGHRIADDAEKKRISDVLNSPQAVSTVKVKVRRVLPALGTRPEGAATEQPVKEFTKKVRDLESLTDFTLETPIALGSKQTVTVGIPASQPLDKQLAKALITDAKRNSQNEIEVQIVSPYESIPVALNPIDTQTAQLCTNFNEFKKLIFKDFETTFAAKELPSNGFPIVDAETFTDQNRLSYLMHAVYGFFNNGGTRCYIKLTTEGKLDEALAEFDAIEEIAIVVAPGITKQDQEAIAAYCRTGADGGNFYRFAIFDSQPKELPNDKLAVPDSTDYAAFYYPWIKVADPATKIMNPQGDGLLLVPPSGHVAGIYARVDNLRGVHKAPANEVVFGALGVERNVSKVQQQGLNPKGINCIRDLNGNIRVWGARTIGEANGEFTYISTRRLFLYLRHSIDKATQWTVFEPNNAELWAKIRRNVNAFLTTTWQSGALFGATPQEAFYVKCDAENNPPEVRELGQVVIEIGVAVTKPAEFVIFRISQWSPTA